MNFEMLSFEKLSKYCIQSTSKSQCENVIVIDFLPFRVDRSNDLLCCVIENVEKFMTMTMMMILFLHLFGVVNLFSCDSDTHGGECVCGEERHKNTPKWEKKRTQENEQQKERENVESSLTLFPVSYYTFLKYI